MKVIFTDNISGVASRGDIKNVKNGYYRNFLNRFAKAVPATKGNLKEWEDKRKKVVIDKEQLKGKLEEIKRRLNEVKLKIEKKVTAKGTLYGGVKASDVVAAIKGQFNIEVPEESVIFESPIKAVGTYNIRLNFGENVETALPLEVVQK
mgnify:CR=1 FL=1